MTPRVRILLATNIVAFFLQQFLAGLTHLFWFLPSAAFFRPWTFVTYMFLHGGIIHILFNMLGLYFFGSQVEERLGARKFTILYFLSGISGALLHMALVEKTPIIGASGGVFGVMMAFAYFWPKAPILIWGIIPVPAALLVLLTTIFALYSGMGGSQGGVADFAHLGGYAGAFLYLKWLERSRVAFRKKAEGADIVIKPRGSDKRPVVNMQNIHELNRDEVNRILDKISAEGMKSLTPQEKVFLSNFVPPDDRVPPVS